MRTLSSRRRETRAAEFGEAGWGFQRVIPPRSGRSKFHNLRGLRAAPNLDQQRSAAVGVKTARLPPEESACGFVRAARLSTCSDLSYGVSGL